MNIPENILNTLTEEQKKKVEAAQSPEELLALAKEAGYELSTDELEAVSNRIDRRNNLKNEIAAINADLSKLQRIIKA